MTPAEIQNLDDQELNRRIAERLGWKWGPSLNSHWPDGWAIERADDPGFYDIGNDYLPDYAGCLNACHEAEEGLDGPQELAYLTELGRRDVYCNWGSVHATARQRAEALLTVLTYDYQPRD